MTRAWLARLRSRVEQLRGRGGIRAVELERLARAVGRRQHPRGKEPTWISTVLPHARPLSIPRHAGDLNRFTARAILDQLDADIDALEAMTEREHP